MLLVHFGCHEFGRADDGLGERAVLERGKSQVTDLDGARSARDEDVVALRIRCQVFRFVLFGGFPTPQESEKEKRVES